MKPEARGKEVGNRGDYLRVRISVKLKTESPESGQALRTGLVETSRKGV